MVFNGDVTVTGASDGRIPVSLELSSSAVPWHLSFSCAQLPPASHVSQQQTHNLETTSEATLVSLPPPFSSAQLPPASHVSQQQTHNLDTTSEAPTTLRLRGGAGPNLKRRRDARRNKGSEPELSDDLSPDPYGSDGSSVSPRRRTPPARASELPPVEKRVTRSTSRQQAIQAPEAGTSSTPSSRLPARQSAKGSPTASKASSRRKRDALLSDAELRRELVQQSVDASRGLKAPKKPPHLTMRSAAQLEREYTIYLQDLETVEKRPAGSLSSFERRWMSETVQARVTGFLWYLVRVPSQAQRWRGLTMYILGLVAGLA